MRTAEVIVVGGGPAGSTCAWTLARAGKECLVLDAKMFPRIKPCAGWTSPRVFETLGIAPGSYPHGLTRLDRIHFHFRGVRVPIATRQLAIRRWEFDEWLLRRAGVQVVQHRVQEIARHDDGFDIDGRFRCRLLVGAGGTACPVYRGLFAEADPRSPASLIVALEAELSCRAPDPECHLWFLDRGLPGYSWYLPKEGGFVAIGVGGIATRVRRAGGIRQHWEQLLQRLARLGLEVGSECTPRGYAYHLRRGTPAVQQDGAFLIGDAAGLATVDMGEGIAAAVRSGILAAHAISTGAPYTVRSLPRYSIPHMIMSRYQGRRFWQS
ncbi:MAG TPA: NAD(P)/FAD-dependent oxidoreductase [Thermoanaerobaculaceae bacterium]|nr:NAD(P)/FAD-dependent oxidoreductase [Thermoanaerobaculaceae bacterium]